MAWEINTNNGECVRHITSQLEHRTDIYEQVSEVFTMAILRLHQCSLIALFLLTTHTLQVSANLYGKRTGKLGNIKFISILLHTYYNCSTCMYI